ncbi:MAG: BamA/TamA family outer membrane protein [Calditrichaceae bacterium]
MYKPQMKLLIKLAILFLYVFSAGLFAQNKDSFKQNPEFVIESISVEGNSKTSESVILENLPFSAGDKVSEKEIKQSVDGLNRLNFFKEVAFSPRAGSQPGYLNLIITVRERYWPSIRFKGGFSEMDSWHITPISIHFDNIFGLGNFTNIDLTIGDRLSSINLNYINPNIFNSGLDLYTKLFIKNHVFVHYLDSLRLKQNVPQSGLSLGFKARETFFKHFLFALETYTTIPDSFATHGKDKEKFYDFPDQIDEYIHDEWKTSVFSIYFNWDGRDQVSYPTKGWWTGFRFTQATKELGGQIDFTRFVADARYYQYLFAGTVAAGRIKFATISSDAPFYEKFYLGGPNSLRGFRDRSLSPDGGGERLYQAGLEIRFPIIRKNYPNHFLTGVLFWDSGMNLLESDTFDINKMDHGVGYGFRFRIPFIGLVRMDMAYPLTEGEYRIHFSLGHTF